MGIVNLSNVDFHGKVVLVRTPECDEDREWEIGVKNMLPTG